jgi:hypothetical protein
MRTPEVAIMLRVAEVRLWALLRLRRVTPPVVCGRAAWGAQEVRAAAKIIGRNSPALIELWRAEAKGGSDLACLKGNTGTLRQSQSEMESRG